MLDWEPVQGLMVFLLSFSLAKEYANFVSGSLYFVSIMATPHLPFSGREMTKASKHCQNSVLVLDDVKWQ